MLLKIHPPRNMSSGKPVLSAQAFLGEREEEDRDNYNLTNEDIDSI